MGVTQEELQEAVSKLVQDVRTHDEIITAVQSNVTKLSSDFTSLRDMQIETNGKNEVYMSQISNQNEKMLTMLMDSNKRRDDDLYEERAAERALEANNNKQMWLTIGTIAAGLGSLVSLLINLL